MSLDERCIQLLREVQSRLLTERPVRYPNGKFGGDCVLGICFLQLMFDLDVGEGGLRFYESSLIVEVATSEGAIEYNRARSRCVVQKKKSDQKIDED